MNKLFFIIALILFLSCIARADEFRKWTDENGVTHIINVPDSNKDEQSTPEDTSVKLDKRYKEINEKYEREKERIRQESKAREKQYVNERCESARKNEKYYRDKYRNARTQEMTDYYKQQLDEIEETCKKTGY